MPVGCVGWRGLRGLRGLRRQCFGHSGVYGHRRGGKRHVQPVGQGGWDSYRRRSAKCEKFDELQIGGKLFVQIICASSRAGGQRGA